LRDVLYNPGEAKLDIDSLPPEFEQLGKGLLFFVASVDEVRALAKALANGDLSGSLPSPNNDLAAPLKSLHASLRHLTWQSQQVARGDYKQRVDFMGEFAVAFNTMIVRLDEQRSALINEIENSYRKTIELEQSNKFFEDITRGITPWIIVIDREDLKWLFWNHEIGSMLKDSELAEELKEWLQEQTARFNEKDAAHRASMDMAKEEALLSFDTESNIAIMTEFPPQELSLKGEETQYFSVTFYPLNWRERSALACVLSDISTEKRHLLELEDYAYRDALTNVYSRHYGMKTLREWLEARRDFSLCFVDLDNLKFVNDKYKHDEGDKYILRIVETLKDFGDDVVITRLGGDEFMMLTETKCIAAEERLEELRTNLKKRYSREEYTHSFSYGVVNPGEVGTYVASEILGLADEKMYAYKRAHKVQRGVMLPADAAASS
jgi:diguanylate cyclase (GGDEF)-like protein